MMLLLLSINLAIVIKFNLKPKADLLFYFPQINEEEEEKNN